MRVLVVGTGGLSASFCQALPGVLQAPLDVVVLGRSERAVRSIVYRSHTRAHLFGRPVSFAGVVVDVFSAASIRGALDGPVDLVVVLASAHLPWEKLDRPSAWTDYLSTAGFGATVPLQMAVVEQVCSALPGTPVVNGCYPDGVNPILAALGHDVVCGVGNVGLIAASIEARLEVDGPRLHVLAHHVDLAAARDREHPRIWVDGTQQPWDPDLVADQREVPGPLLNDVTGASAAQAVAALVERRSLSTHLPGPRGLPGGYPVHIEEGEVHLRLPPGLDEAELVAWNVRRTAAEGLVFDGDQLRMGPELGAVAITDLARATRELLELRERLRALPSEHAPSGTDPTLVSAVR